MGPRTVCDVVVNAHRERIRLLEYHSDALSQHIYIHAFEYILSVKKDLSVDAASLDKVVHTVD